MVMPRWPMIRPMKIFEQGKISVSIPPTAPAPAPAPAPPQAAGSIHAARDLASGACDVAVHWGGGMHHGMPYRAFGFCYVNDLVLAVLELVAGCGRVLYIGEAVGRLSAAGNC